MIIIIFLLYFDILIINMCGCWKKKNIEITLIDQQSSVPIKIESNDSIHSDESKHSLSDLDYINSKINLGIKFKQSKFSWNFGKKNKTKILFFSKINIDHFQEKVLFADHNMVIMTLLFNYDKCVVSVNKVNSDYLINLFGNLDKIKNKHINDIEINDDIIENMVHVMLDNAVREKKINMLFLHIGKRQYALFSVPVVSNDKQKLIIFLVIRKPFDKLSYQRFTF